MLVEIEEEVEIMFGWEGNCWIWDDGAEVGVTCEPTQTERRNCGGITTELLNKRAAKRLTSTLKIL